MQIDIFSQKKTKRPYKLAPAYERKKNWCYCVFEGTCASKRKNRIKKDADIICIERFECKYKSDITKKEIKKKILKENLYFVLSILFFVSSILLLKFF